jgi:hypothetical protein
VVTAAKDKLETRSLTGVEILAPGRWNGDDYSSDHLDAAVLAFHELGPDGTGQIRPPGKLGHDKGQKLAQTDGYPAIGWVTNLYRSGLKLLADFAKVPAKVAELIEAGAYDQISSECYFDLSLNDKVYPFVIKAVSFLGADTPAVKDIKSIADVARLFSEANFPGQVVHLAEYAAAEPIGTDDNPDPDNDGDDDRPGSRNNPDADDGDLAEDDLGSLLAAHDAYMSQVNTMIAGKPGAKRVRTFLGTARREIAGMKKPPFANNTEVNDMDIKTLAETLGLPATATEAEVLAKIAENKAKAEEQKTATLTEVELRERVATLEATQKSQRIAKLIDDAVLAKKASIGERDELVKIGMLSEEVLAESLSKRTEIAKLGAPLGRDSDNEDEPKEPTQMESTLAAQLGVSAKALTEHKADTRPLMERAREMREKAGVA